MRRIASFVARRVDKSDAPSTTPSSDESVPQDTMKRKARTLNSLSRKLGVPLRAHHLGSDSAYSSSSGSSGSAEPHTPDEEMRPRTTSQRGSWRSWLGGKKERHEGDVTAVTGHLTAFPTTTMGSRPPPIARSRLNDTDDTSSELEDDPPIPCMTQARNNMRAIILNSSVDPPSCPPLLHSPDGSLFPRSCLYSNRIRRRETLELKIHKRALLQKLESLSAAEERSIGSLSTRAAILVKEVQAQDPNIDAWPKTEFLKGSSDGLGNWVDRPYFEDRVLVWTQEPSDQIVSANVAGPQLGVAALEFSEPLQILAGWKADEDDAGPEPAPSLPDHDSSTAAVALASCSVSPIIPEETTSPEREPPAPPVKRGVRFAEDGKDDLIPLGYVLRIKKQREEKARFLRQEREKRELEEAKRAREEQRRLRLLEAKEREQEKERIALELHKRKVEDEKRRQNYANELQASRTRREVTRAGHNISSSSSLVRDMERDRSASRDTRSSPRTLDTPNLSPYDGSPASSMPATPQGSQPSFSRPPSVYSIHTTSSEGTRARDGRHINRHSTLVFDPSKQSPLPSPNLRPPLPPYNMWASAQVPPLIVPQVPPFPPAPMMNYVPFYSMDMPLLPPTPPFMMNQFGYRQRPTNFSQSQMSSFKHSTSSNHSADLTHRTSCAPNPNPPSFSAHHRRASDDARTHSNTTNILPDRKYGSQTDLRGKRSPPVAHTSRGSNLHHPHQPPSSTHSHTLLAKPASTSQSRPPSNRRQSTYS